MFKLLLVTDRPEVAQTFGSITNWESMGFRAPRVVSSPAEAEESLARHHADAVAVQLAPEEEHALLRLMAARYPLTPLMRASANPAEVEADTAEVDSLLHRTRADYSNDRYDAAEGMQLCRHEYFRRMIGGQERDPQRVRRKLRLLRSRMDPDRPCVLLTLALPSENGYLSDHWRYGADRLEVAMRNIFGAEIDGMRVLVSVLPEDKLYLLACPMLDMEAPEGQAMLDEVIRHATEGIRHVKEYLDIDLHIASVTGLPSILSLSDSMGGEAKK